MKEQGAPAFYYLFMEGADIQIVRITDERAAELWELGKPFIGVGLKTKAEAEAFRSARLALRMDDAGVNGSRPRPTFDSAAQSLPDSARSA